MDNWQSKQQKKKLCDRILVDYKKFSEVKKEADALWKTDSDGNEEISAENEEKFLEMIDSLLYQHELLLESYLTIKDNE
jgi:hypothetical protein